MNKLTQETINVNMELYNRYRAVPENAQKKITGGRLNGMTDINPMWRIKCLTESFGACGEGWYVEVLDTSIERSAEEAVATVKVALYYKVDGEWSKPVVGIGGSKLMAKERASVYMDDEAIKKAYTDAIGICCKMLGMGADIWWNADTTKYNTPTEPEELYFRCEDCGAVIKGGKYQGKEYGARDWTELTKNMVKKQLCPSCMRKTNG